MALAVPFAVFLGIYAVSVGHGFVADDFGWILDSRVSSIAGVPALFLKSSGFYRPLVGLTFAADYAVFGNHPLGYGLTNLALAIVCGVLLYAVARELLLPSGAALLAVALWLLNPHGINTAILWMSGRTSLMLTLGSLGAVWLVLRGRPFAALAPAAIALFAKEEAFLLPAILLMWWYAFRPDDLPKRKAIAWCVAAGALVGVYLALRVPDRRDDPVDGASLLSLHRKSRRHRPQHLRVRRSRDDLLGGGRGPGAAAPPSGRAVRLVFAARADLRRRLDRGRIRPHGFPAGAFEPLRVLPLDRRVPDRRGSRGAPLARGHARLAPEGRGRGHGGGRRPDADLRAAQPGVAGQRAVLLGGSSRPERGDRGDSRGRDRRGPGRSHAAAEHRNRVQRGQDLYGIGSVAFYGTSITVADLTMSDGGRLEKVGVTPDELVLPTAADLAGQRDPVLARAIAILGGTMTAEEAGKFYR